METVVSVKPTLAHISKGGVVGTSSRLDTEFMAVRQDKGRRLTGPSKLSVGEAMSPPRHLASSSWALGHGERRVSPSSSHRGLRVVGSAEGVCHLYGSESWAPS